MKDTSAGPPAQIQRLMVRANPRAAGWVGRTESGKESIGQTESKTANAQQQEQAEHSSTGMSSLQLEHWTEGRGQRKSVGWQRNSVFIPRAKMSL